MYEMKTADKAKSKFTVPYLIALICVFLPFFSVHLTFAISIYFDNLNLCIPYWQQCHSISATGRQYPEFFFFKALLIPAAVFMAAYWLLLYQWLQNITNGQIRARTITIMGLIASIALVVYTVTLGAVGEPYALARRIGVIFYFAFTSFAHLILLHTLEKVDTLSLQLTVYKQRLMWISSVLVSTAIISVLLGYFWSDGWDNWENAYEWWFAVLMVAMFYQVAKMWKTTGFEINISTSKSSS